MNIGSVLVVIGFIILILVVANLVPKRAQNVNTENANLKNEEKSREVELGVWSGLKFGFGFGLGLMILSFLTSIVLMLAGFSLMGFISKILSQVISSSMPPSIF